MVSIHPLPADEDAARRFAAELWLPYNRDLETVVETHALVDDVPLEEEVEFRLDLLESEGYRAWIAVDTDESGESIPSLAAVDSEFVGFITAELDRAPPVFDRPDSVLIGDFYVRESYRGTELARDLFDHVVDWARDSECTELTLNVDVDNERALGFYEKIGFEPRRWKMAVSVDSL